MTLAVLIDAENISATHYDFVAAQIRDIGTAIIFRLFADFTNPAYSGWLDLAKRHGLEPVLQCSGGKGKNSADIALTIHAMDILHEGAVQAICLVSSDRDFAPLAQRLRAGGMQVYGLGRADAHAMLRAACTRFFGLTVTVAPAAVAKPVPAAPAPKRAPKAAPPITLERALREIVAAKGVEGWITLPVAAKALREVAPKLAEQYCGKGKFLRNLRASGTTAERMQGNILQIQVRTGSSSGALSPVPQGQATPSSSG
ncbi:MAG: hypothetical protein JWN11_2059 [Hyphomicrobiales bacterium]|nr:hypothetical protein [Hyphomicrobiales bacterium]